MIEAPHNINRRKFINGRWSTRAGESSTGCTEIASVLVQTRPEKLDGAIDAIEALQGAEIFGRDPKGKIVVVLEAMDVDTIGETLGAISALPGVLTASLVFHGTTE